MFWQVLSPKSAARILMPIWGLSFLLLATQYFILSGKKKTKTHTNKNLELRLKTHVSYLKESYLEEKDFYEARKHQFKVAHYQAWNYDNIVKVVSFTPLPLPLDHLHQNTTTSLVGNNHFHPRKNCWKPLKPFCSWNQFFTPGWISSSQQGIAHTTSTPCHRETPFPSFKHDVMRDQQRCCTAPLRPEHFSLPTTTTEPAQLPFRRPGGKHQVWDQCYNAGGRAEHCWDGFQPCRWGIPQCLGHSNSYTSRVKAPKHSAKENPRQEKPLRAEQSQQYGLQCHKT